MPNKAQQEKLKLIQEKYGLKTLPTIADVEEFATTGTFSPTLTGVTSSVPQNIDYTKNGRLRNIQDLKANLEKKGYKDLKIIGDKIFGMKEGKNVQWGVQPDGFASVMEDKTGQLITDNMPTQEEVIFNQEQNRGKVTPEEEALFLEAGEAINKPYFDKKEGEATFDYNKNISNIERLTQYARSDTVKDLLKLNQTFAKTMSRATNVYGQRNLLGSGIQRETANEATSSLEKDIYNRNDYLKRQEEQFGEQKQNIKTQYSRGMDELASTEEAMKYSEAMKLSQARQDEYTRMYSDTQKAPTFQTTTNTVAPDNVMTGADATKKALKSNY